MDGYPMLSPPNGINWDERREPVAMSGHVLPGIDEKNTSLALHFFFLFFSIFKLRQVCKWDSSKLLSYYI